MKNTKTKLVCKDYRIPDALWEESAPLIPKHRPKQHPLGCQRQRVADRNAMNAIFFVLKTGCQWNALKETGICSSSSAHRRFQEWTRNGVFRKIWRHSVERYDLLKGIDWSFCSTDGAMTKAPLGGEKNREESDRERENRNNAQSHDRPKRYSAFLPGGGCQQERLQDA